MKHGMKIRELINNIPDCHIIGDDACLIQGISTHSKEVRLGDLFLVKKGRAFNAEDFVPDVVKKGACAIAVDHYLPEFAHIPQLIHPQISQIEAELAHVFYRAPSQELTLIAVTGTSGKTTTSFIIKQLLEKFFSSSCGLIGTIENIIGSQRIKSDHTTPDVVMNHKMLRNMRDVGCTHAVMETTSHALVQGRLNKVNFDVALFSNLSHEHLDYHESMENYAAAKKLLFDSLGASKNEKRKISIVNADDDWAHYMLQNCVADSFSYGIDKPADVKASNIRLSHLGTDFNMTYRGKTFVCHTPLIGKFNVYNCLAAVSTILAQGIPIEEIIPQVSFLNSVPGRLERIPNNRGLSIFVDFAHKPDALLKVLTTLRELMPKEGRLTVVFGCGGDRDKIKRPKMAEICERYADMSWVTTDNPRSEDPLSICKEIEKGFSSKAKYCIVVDRKEAICKALSSARPSDVILVAGKGHETGQIFADYTLDFDDKEVIMSNL